MNNTSLCLFSHVCQRGWEYRVCGAFSRLRSDLSLDEIWGRGAEDFGKPSSKLVLGFWPCRSLRKQSNLEIPRGHVEIPKLRSQQGAGGLTGALVKWSLKAART